MNLFAVGQVWRSNNGKSLLILKVEAERNKAFALHSSGKVVDLCKTRLHPKGEASYFHAATWYKLVA